MMAGASSPSGRRPAAAPNAVEPSREPESLRERVLGSLPLFIVGGLCLALAVDLYLTGTVSRFGSNGSVRIEPWVLFFALAVTGISAGIFALLLEGVPVAQVEAEPAPVVAPPTTTPEWDESTIEPEKPTYVPPRTWERYPDLPETPTAAPMPYDSVLDQIDEIAASLRKRPQTPPPD